MIMTENFKQTLKIILNCYKEDKMSEEEVLTVLETLIKENNVGGGNIITYPVYPTYPNWWDNIHYNTNQPYCGDGHFCYSTTTDSLRNNEKQDNGTYTTNVNI